MTAFGLFIIGFTFLHRRIPMSNPIDRVHKSLKRCNRDPRFLDLFYETFFNASPEIARKFADTDMHRQKRMVEASLYTSILAAENVPYAVSSIKKLGEQHRHLDVQPSMYQLWLESLIQAIATCDDAFDADVEAAWRAVLNQSIDMMLAMYKE